MDLDLLRREVGRPTWKSTDPIPGFDISAAVEKIFEGGKGCAQDFFDFLKTPEIKSHQRLFLRIDLRTLVYPQKTKLLKLFIEEGRSKQKKTAVLVCSPEEYLENSNILTNVFNSGVHWQEQEEQQ